MVPRNNVVLKTNVVVSVPYQPGVVPPTEDSSTHRSENTEPRIENTE